MRLHRTGQTFLIRLRGSGAAVGASPTLRSRTFCRRPIVSVTASLRARSFPRDHLALFGRQLADRLDNVIFHLQGRAILLGHLEEQRRCIDSLLHIEGDSFDHRRWKGNAD